MVLIVIVVPFGPWLLHGSASHVRGNEISLPHCEHGPQWMNRPNRDARNRASPGDDGPNLKGRLLPEYSRRRDTRNKETHLRRNDVTIQVKNPNQRGGPNSKSLQGGQSAFSFLGDDIPSLCWVHRVWAA